MFGSNTRNGDSGAQHSQAAQDARQSRAKLDDANASTRRTTTVSEVRRTR